MAYESLKPWIRFPLTIRPFVKRTGSGTKEFGRNRTTRCYPVHTNQLVTETTGAEVVSTTQLYVDATTQVTEMDNVIFEGQERPIKKVTTHYDGNTGAASIRTVYL